MTRILLLAALLASTHAFAGEGVARPSRTGADTAPAAAMRIHRDPVTGQLGAEAPAGKSAEIESPVAGPNYDTLVYEQLEDGAVAMWPTENEFHSAAFATVGADGELHEGCAQGSAHAHDHVPPRRRERTTEQAQ